MKRTPLSERKLPAYTRKEEIINSATHAAGAVFGAAALAACTAKAVETGGKRAVIGAVIYGAMMIFLFSMSSVYHGLKDEGRKKFFQVIDHCSIFAMILGTYAPILLTGIYEQNRKLFFIIASLVFAGTAVGVFFTAVDVNRYKPVSMVCYIAIGWSVVLAVKPLVAAFSLPFFLWLLAGGIAFTVGVIFYVIGPRKKYFHSIFHVFILIGAVLQFIGIYKYCF